MKIFIGADHRGYALKTALQKKLNTYDWHDLGCSSEARTDFPVYASKVSAEVLKNSGSYGILICGSGIGMSIAANRHKGIFAALCWNPEVAQSARADDNANILVLPANIVDEALAAQIIQSFLETPFKGGVYEQRLCMIDN